MILLMLGILGFGLALTYAVRNGHPRVSLPEEAEKKSVPASPSDEVLPMLEKVLPPQVRVRGDVSLAELHRRMHLSDPGLYKEATATIDYLLCRVSDGMPIAAVIVDRPERTVSQAATIELALGDAGVPFAQLISNPQANEVAVRKTVEELIMSRLLCFESPAARKWTGNPWRTRTHDARPRRATAPSHRVFTAPPLS